MAIARFMVMRSVARSSATDRGVMADTSLRAPLRALVALLLLRALVQCLQWSRRFLPCFVALLLWLRHQLMGILLRLLVLLVLL